MRLFSDACIVLAWIPCHMLLPLCFCYSIPWLLQPEQSYSYAELGVGPCMVCYVRKKEAEFWILVITAKFHIWIC